MSDLDRHRLRHLDRDVIPRPAERDEEVADHLNEADDLTLDDDFDQIGTDRLVRGEPATAARRGTLQEGAHGAHQVISTLIMTPEELKDERVVSGDPQIVNRAIQNGFGLVKRLNSR